MTKETMIWQTLSMIIAGMIRRNEIPETVEAFENKAVELAGSVLAYPDKEIHKVLETRDCTGFAMELSYLYNEDTTGQTKISSTPATEHAKPCRSC